MWWVPEQPPAIKLTWSQEIPLHVRAMVKADETLFIAGPPDLIDEEAVFGRADTAANRALLADQANAFEGRRVPSFGPSLQRTGGVWPLAAWTSSQFGTE
jgi:hypothetical protein